MKDDKRQDYIKKPEAFMSIAKLIAKRSKDPNSQVGAVIGSNEDRILSLGYNGFPNGCSDDDFPWVRDIPNVSDPDTIMLDTKYAYVVHAELNAILNFKGPSLAGSTLYVTMFPCNECAKAIIQSGIKQVIYYEDKYPDTPSHEATIRMFKAAGVTLMRFQDEMYKVRLMKLFFEINRDLPKIDISNQDKAYDQIMELIETKYKNMVLVP